MMSALTSREMMACTQSGPAALAMPRARHQEGKFLMHADRNDGRHDVAVREYSEDDYLAHLHGFDDELVDPVATPAEWRRFKAAALRWLAELEADVQEGFDNTALEEEHGDA